MFFFRLYPNTSDNNYTIFGSNRTRTRTRTKGVGLQTALIIFNNLLAPLIAIFASDTTCFLNVLVNSSLISSSFSYQVCSYVNGITQVCDIYKVVIVETDFQPPFIYSFQCSSALLTTYVPIFIIMYSYIILFVPVTDFIRLYACRSDTLTRYPSTKKIVLSHTSLLLKPIEHTISMMAAILHYETQRRQLTQRDTMVTRGNVSHSDFDNLIVSNNLTSIRDIETILHDSSEDSQHNLRNSRSSLSLQSEADSLGEIQMPRGQIHELAALQSGSVVENIFLDKNIIRHMPQVCPAGNMASSFICSVIILMTYGTSYPPLAIVVTLALVVETMHVQYLIARYWKMILDIPTNIKLTSKAPPIDTSNDCCRAYYLLPEPSKKIKHMLHQQRIDAGLNDGNTYQSMYLVEDAFNHKISESIPYSPLQLQLVTVLEETFSGIFKIMKQTTPSIILFTSVFFAFFVFDMIGDSSADEQYQPIYIIVALFPVFILIASFMWDNKTILSRWCNHGKDLDVEPQQQSNIFITNNKSFDNGNGLQSNSVLHDCSSIVPIHNIMSSIVQNQVAMPNRDGSDGNGDGDREMSMRPSAINPIIARMSSTLDMTEC